LIDWESIWAPYDEDTYRFVIERVGARDVVVDIGAGDLRLARRLAGIAEWVYAVERNPAVMSRAGDLIDAHDHLTPVCIDALKWPLPRDTSVAVLLMRHCTREHFAEYVRRLKAAGCHHLITNARWKMGVEEIDLRSGRAYDPGRMGWYACQCGAVGFTPGEPAQLTDDMLNVVAEVINCPNCSTT